MNGKRLCALILAMVMVLSCNLTAFAVDETDVTDDTSGVEETVDDESDAEIAPQDQDENQVVEDASEESAVTEPEVTDEQKVEEQPEQAEEAEVQAASETEEATELKENSWRYQNGEMLNTERERSTYPYAWSKVNGVFVNNYGSPIPGAVKKGIDISEHNGWIDWNALKNSDVDYVIIRCGYGDDDSRQDDKRWAYNITQCEKYGIPYGVYIYSYARTTTQAQSEANHVLRLIRGHKLTYPVYFDMEDDTTLGLSKAQYASIARTFCNAISNAGYKPGIYANLNWFSNYLTDSVFDNSGWSKWVAQYNYKCDYSKPYDMWQSSSTAHVSGISTNVDVNFWVNKSIPTGSSINEDLTGLKYCAHVQDYGWTSYAGDGSVVGTEGISKRMEAIKVEYGDGTYNKDISLQAHVQDYGWMSWKSGGQVIGTEGQSKRIEAIRIKLSGTLGSQYDVYYRVHIQDYGWLDWAYNGRTAGSEAMSKRVEAIQIKLVKKGSGAPGATTVSFRNHKLIGCAHVQDYGWLSYAENGSVIGTQGQSKRLEAVILQGSNGISNAELEYRVHVQDYGWQDWRSGGGVAGTSGQAKRLEAISIQLSGNAANQYDVYYRTHIQDYGWLDWTKNGGLSGSEGLSKRMEAIQIILVPKGEGAPGSTNRAFVKN